VEELMSSYQMELQGDVLRVGFNRTARANGDLVVRDALRSLEQMQERGQLQGGKLLKIDGPQSIAVAYTLGHKLAHLYSAIAILDPKIGRVGYKTYIVTSSHSPDYQVGDRIETEEPQTERNSVKLVLCGPPHSGKSCLREGLKWQIMSRLNAPYPYVITACPDGEPAGSQEIYGRDPQLARDIKQGYKGILTLEYARKIADAVESANGLINIIDIGGIPSDENKLIVGKCTHAAILASGDRTCSHQDRWAEWESYCTELGVPVIAKIHSDYDATRDRVDEDSALLTGAIHHLSRGEDVSDRPMIHALADLVVELTKLDSVQL
jgi:CRISPR-associated protein Csx3